MVGLFEEQGVERHEVEAALGQFPVDEVSPVLYPVQRILVDYYDNLQDQRKEHELKVKVHKRLGLPEPDFVYDVRMLPVLTVVFTVPSRRWLAVLSRLCLM